MPLTLTTQRQGRSPARARDEFRRDVLQGLRSAPKRLPCKYFYDLRGSQLFDRICQLDAYYLTRTELQIMEESGREIGQQLGPHALVVELGSGSSVKTRLLLDHLDAAVGYCPVDISREHLLETATRLSVDYPQIEILPIVADFVQQLELPRTRRTPASVSVYFPGSTVGNFQPAEAVALLQRIRRLCQPHGGLLIGFDLEKEIRVIEAAYNDPQGVTEQFNLNLLQRINRELDGDFQLGAFRHRAFYDPRHRRVDISLVSRRRQTVTVAGESFNFSADEAIHTEYSHKYTVDSFASLAGEAGFRLRHVWTDPRRYFAVAYLEAGDSRETA